MNDSLLPPDFMQLNQDELFEALSLLIQRIEACGASPALTDAVVLASDISASVGNRWNPSQPERTKMVRSKLKPSREVELAKALQFAAEQFDAISTILGESEPHVDLILAFHKSEYSAFQVREALKSRT